MGDAFELVHSDRDHGACKGFALCIETRRNFYFQQVVAAVSVLPIPHRTLLPTTYLDLNIDGTA